MYLYVQFMKNCDYVVVIITYVIIEIIIYYIVKIKYVVIIIY